MAVTGKLYGLFWQSVLNKELDIDSDNFKLALFTSSLAINQNTHRYFDAAPYTSNQVTGTNYTAGGKLITPGSFSYDSATKKLSIGFANAQWLNATIAAWRYGIAYCDTPASNKPLVGYVDYGADQSATNGTINSNWDAAGTFYVTVA